MLGCFFPVFLPGLLLDRAVTELGIVGPPTEIYLRKLFPAEYRSFAIPVLARWLQQNGVSGGQLRSIMSNLLSLIMPFEVIEGMVCYVWNLSLVWIHIES